MLNWVEVLPQVWRAETDGLLLTIKEYTACRFHGCTIHDFSEEDHVDLLDDVIHSSDRQYCQSIMEDAAERHIEFRDKPSRLQRLQNVVKAKFYQRFPLDIIIF